MNRFSTALALMTILFTTTAVFAQQSGPSSPGPGPRQFYFYHHSMFHGAAVILPFVILFALIGFFAVIGFVVRISVRGPRWRRGGWGRPHMGSALSILEERFARGEIDRTEFEDKRKLLSQR